MTSEQMPERIWADLGRYTPHLRMYSTEYIRADRVRQEREHFFEVLYDMLTVDEGWYRADIMDLIDGLRRELDDE